MTTAPLTQQDILDLANKGKSIPTDRALATFADPANWVQLYGATASDGTYKPKACEWAWRGPTRPPYELAQWACLSLDADRIKPLLMVLEDIATDDLDRVSGGVKQSAQQALAQWEKGK